MTDHDRRTRVRATWITGAIAAAVVVAAVGTVHAASAANAGVSTATATATAVPDVRPTHVASVSDPSGAPTAAPIAAPTAAGPTAPTAAGPTAPTAASTATRVGAAPEAATGSAASDAWARSLASAPAVPGTDPADIDELAGVFCQALASPTMSPRQFDRLLALEEQQWRVTPDEATGLLAAAAADACPTEAVVVTSRGATSPPADTASVPPGDV